MIRGRHIPAHGRPRTPRIALTPGEPAGIGPDICAKLARRAHDAEIVAFADPALLEERARRLGVSLRLEPFDPGAEPRPQAAGTLKVHPAALRAPARCGAPDTANAPYVVECLRAAVDACLAGACDALVTGPVHKGILNDAGIPFTGHTEFIGERTGGLPVMLLAAPGLRVALATTHLPLRQVPDALTRERLERVLRTLHRDLAARFGIREPRILVCGLNPHAGEGGHLGGEEREVIIPVLDALRSEGLRLEGPLPADTLFTPRHLEHTDAVLAMYHDQGLPVLKHLGFGRAVNITLGLPIVRTSVDHGTALELAGTGKADAGSLEAALETAVTLAARQGS